MNLKLNQKMVQSAFEEYFELHKRKPFEHTLRLYPNQASVYVDKKTYKKLHGQCMRAAFYSCMGYEELSNTTINGSLAGRLGDYVEKMILDILRSDGTLVDSGVKFELMPYKIYGKLDGIMNIDGEEVGLEVKSISSSKYITNQIFGTPWQKPFPKWQHLFQTLIYCYAFREKLDNFVLLYIRRDTCEIKEFVISIATEGKKMYPVVNGEICRQFTINDMLDRYLELSEYISSGKTPPREYMPVYPQDKIPLYYKLGIISKKQLDSYHKEPFGDIECKSCPHAYRCMQEPNEGTS